MQHGLVKVIEKMGIEKEAGLACDDYDGLVSRLPKSTWLFYWLGISDLVNLSLVSKDRHLMSDWRYIIDCDSHHRTIWSHMIYYQLLFQIRQHHTVSMANQEPFASCFHQSIIDDFRARLDVCFSLLLNYQKDYNDFKPDSEPLENQQYEHYLTQLNQKILQQAHIALDGFSTHIERIDDFTQLCPLWSEANEVPVNGMILLEDVLILSSKILKTWQALFDDSTELDRAIIRFFTTATV